MPTFSASDPTFWQTSPAALAYTSVFADAVGHKVASFVLGEDDEAESPLALFMKLPPGWVLDRHAHDCHRFEVVLQGSIIVSNDLVLNPGDVSTSGPGEQYGPHMAGPEGSLTLEIFSRQAGLHPVYDSPKEASDGVNKVIDDLRAGLLSPGQAASSPVIAAWAAEAIMEQPQLKRRVLADGVENRV